MGSVNKLIAFMILELIVLCGLLEHIQAYRVIQLHGMSKVLALENETVPIVCKTGEPMAYCGFVHPSGKRLSVSGHTLIDGKCAVSIVATQKDSGIWKCHIGRSTTGEEIEKKIEVSISGQLTALRRNVTISYGKDVTLACVTTRDKIPLRYCRFEPPQGIPFSINSVVKKSQPILDRYYYPQNMSTDRGDCAVTITYAKYKDSGIWTCGVGLDDGQEYTDVIEVDIEGLLSAASSNRIAMIALAIVGIIAILGVIAWKRGQILGAVRQPQGIEIQELGPRMPSPGRRSQRSMTPVRSLTPVRALTPVRTIPTVVVQSPSEKSKGSSVSPI